MNKIIEFLKQSNRYKHLIGGLLVGFAALNPWTALYVHPLSLPPVWNSKTN